MVAVEVGMLVLMVPLAVLAAVVAEILIQVAPALLAKVTTVVPAMFNVVIKPVVAAVAQGQPVISEPLVQDYRLMGEHMPLVAAIAVLQAPQIPQMVVRPRKPADQGL
jgi:hypothetical protein